ncbi:MAG TPA: condensation domain-containing protein, partial [Thermoanaerobaculia bacterium]
MLVSEVDRHTLSALPVEEVAAAVRQALAAEHEVRLSELVLLRQGSLPRTSSGKVQRHACRDLYLHGGLLVVGRSGEGLAADTETNTQEAEDAAEPGEQIEPVERFLLAALARVVRVDPARIDRGLAMSSYGLDSLAAVELHNAIEAEFGAAPSLVELLEGITLAAAARGVAARSAAVSFETGGQTTGEPESEPGWHPLTQGQQALWSLYELAPASAAYNIAGAARLSGVSPIVLGHAFQVLVDRHPSLRTTYANANGPLGPVQRIGAPGVAVLVHEDATEWGEGELLQRVREAAFQPFDLEAGPVLRGTLFDRRAADAADSVLVLAVHHIAADFWSLAVLVRELGRLCSADESTLPALSQPSRISAVEIARGERQRQAAGHYDGMLAAARRQLAGAPPLDLGDRPRPKLQTYGGGLRSRRLGPELDGGLRALARRHDATLFMVLLAGFEALLARSGGQDDFVVGTPTSGRSSRELEGVVGYLVNPVALRADLSRDPDVTTLLARSRRAALDAFARQDLPFPLLAQDLAAERDPSRPPVFQAMLTLQRAPEPGLA